MSNHPAYWTEAMGQGLASGRPEFILAYGLLETIRRAPLGKGLEDLERFLDPDVFCPNLAGDPGWSMYRKPEAGERHRYFGALNARQPDRPKPWPVPAPEEGATADWPKGTRFLAQADVPEDLWDPTYPEEYFTAAEVHEYIRRLMPVYAKYHPESQAQCERVLALSQWWVDHDAVKPPPAGAQTSPI